MGDSMICRTDITNLKTDIGDKIGQKIIVKGSLGRSKAFEKEATIEKAYPNIFVVKYAENDRNVTYSYTDVLTRTVEEHDEGSWDALCGQPCGGVHRQRGVPLFGRYRAWGDGGAGRVTWFEITNVKSA